MCLWWCYLSLGCSGVSFSRLTLSCWQSALRCLLNVCMSYIIEGLQVMEYQREETFVLIWFNSNIYLFIYFGAWKEALCLMLKSESKSFCLEVSVCWVPADRVCTAAPRVTLVSQAVRKLSLLSPLFPNVKHILFFLFLPGYDLCCASGCSDALTSCKCGPLNFHTGVDKSVEDVLNIQSTICIITQWNVTCTITQSGAMVIWLPHSNHHRHCKFMNRL